MGANASTPPCCNRSLISSDEFADTIGQDAPVVTCTFDASWLSNGPRRIAICKDVLMFGLSPGESEDSIVLQNAEVSVQGVSVRVEAKAAPAVTMWSQSAEEAERWSAELIDASQLCDHLHARTILYSNQIQRANSERVVQLETRVNATLQAAVARAQQIAKLEPLVEESKKKDEQIKALSLELEALVNDGSEFGATCVASSAALDDAMEFASQILGDNGEVTLDDSTVLKIRAAVEEVMQTKPIVIAPVAKLVQDLVNALRLPVVLQNRLADAERTIKDQQMLKDKNQDEIVELRQRHEDATMHLRSNSSLLTTLQKQLKLAEDSVEEIEKQRQDRLEDYQKVTQDSTSIADIDELRKERALEAAACQEVHMQISDLQVKLKDAEEVSMEVRGESRQLMLKNTDQEEQLNRLQSQVEDAETRCAMAERLAQDVREQLAAAEQALDESASKHNDSDATHEQNLSQLLERSEMVEVCRDQALAASAKLQEQLKNCLAEQNAEALLASQRLALQDAQEEEIRELRKQCENASKVKRSTEAKLNDLVQRVAESERLAEVSLANQEQAFQHKHNEQVKSWRKRCEDEHQKGMAVEAKLQVAERAALRLQDEAESSKQEATATAQRQMDALKQNHAQEIEELQGRCWTAEKSCTDLETQVRIAEASADEAQQRLALTQHCGQLERAEEASQLRRSNAEAEARLRDLEEQMSHLNMQIASAAGKASSYDELPLPSFVVWPKDKPETYVTGTAQESDADNHLDRPKEDRTSQASLAFVNESEQAQQSPAVMSTKKELEDRLLAAEIAVGKLKFQPSSVVYPGALHHGR